MRRRDHEGIRLLRLPPSMPLSPAVLVLNGLAKARMTGQSAKGFLSLFRVRASRVRPALWRMREWSDDKAWGWELIPGSLGVLFRAIAPGGNLDSRSDEGSRGG